MLVFFQQTSALNAELISISFCACDLVKLATRGQTPAGSGPEVLQTRHAAQHLPAWCPQDAVRGRAQAGILYYESQAHAFSKKPSLASVACSKFASVGGSCSSLSASATAALLANSKIASAAFAAAAGERGERCCER